MCKKAFKKFGGYGLPKVDLGPFLNTLSHIFLVPYCINVSTFRFLQPFWCTPSSKQWSLDVIEKDNGIMSSVHLSYVLFTDFYQVMFC